MMDWINRVFEWMETPIQFEVSPFVALCIVFCVVMMVKVIKAMIWREVA